MTPGGTRRADARRRRSPARGRAQRHDAPVRSVTVSLWTSAALETRDAGDRVAGRRLPDTPLGRRLSRRPSTRRSRPARTRRSCSASRPSDRLRPLPVACGPRPHGAGPCPAGVPAVPRVERPRGPSRSGSPHAVTQPGAAERARTRHRGTTAAAAGTAAATAGAGLGRGSRFDPRGRRGRPGVLVGGRPGTALVRRGRASRTRRPPRGCRP